MSGRFRGGGRSGGRSGGRNNNNNNNDNDSFDGCTLSSYGKAVVGFNVVFAVALIAIAVFWFLRNRKYTGTKPLKWWNYGLALAWTILGAIVSFGLTASDYKCTHFETGDVPQAAVPATWLVTIGYLLLIYTIAVPFLERLWTLGGGNFKLIKLAHWVAFGLLALFALVKLSLQSSIDEGATLSQLNATEGISMVYAIIQLGIAISVIVLAGLSIKNLRGNLGTSFYLLIALFVSFFARSFILFVTVASFNLANDLWTVDQLNATVAFQVIFDIATFALLAIIGTSEVILATTTPTTTSAEVKMENGGVTATQNTGEAVPPPQQTYYPPPQDTQYPQATNGTYHPPPQQPSVPHVPHNGPTQ